MTSTGVESRASLYERYEEGKKKKEGSQLRVRGLSVEREMLGIDVNQ